MYQKWLKAGEARFVSMTGYSINVFNDLLPYFEEAHNHYFSRYEVNGKKKKRFRAFVIYKNSPLPTVANRLSFILSFQKLNPIQEQQADWFNMTQKRCNEFVHSLTIVLDNALMNANVKLATTEKELLQKLDAEKELTLIHDGTEREIPRPVDEEAQKKIIVAKRKNIP